MMTVGTSFRPACISSSFNSSFHSACVYCLVGSISASLSSRMKEANRVSEFRPHPPTPTSIMWPRGRESTREIRQRWAIASSNIT